MADQHGPRERATTWRPGWLPWIAARGRPPLELAFGLAGVAGSGAERLRAWALADTAAGRLMPWLAVAFGCGILLYFTAEQEPKLWAVALLATATIAGAVSARHRP